MVLASSAKASVDETINKAFTGDFVVDTGMFSMSGMSPDVAARINGLPEVKRAAGLRATSVQIEGKTILLTATDASKLDGVVDLGVSKGSLADLDSEGIAVLDKEAKAKRLSVGSRIDVRFAETGVRPLTVRALYSQEQFGGRYLVGLPVYDANVADHFDMKIFVAKKASVSAGAAQAAIEHAVADHPEAQVRDRTGMKAQLASHLDQMLGLVYGLLALALIIALLGIGNTLALSILERTRELGLLRAVGMTRQQLRATVRWEAVIVAIVGGILGLVLGVVFGSAVVKALESQGITVLRIPAGQLIALALLAGVAGLVAAVLPARRAARMDVLAAISSH